MYCICICISQYPLPYLTYLLLPCISGAFFQFDVDILLAQEKFDYNWENIIVPTYKLIPNQYNPYLGIHESSIGQFEYNKTQIKGGFSKNRINSIAFRKLFRSIKTQDPMLWQAMCRLILIDYVCFPQYQLPLSCQHLQNAVENGRELLLKVA